MEKPKATTSIFIDSHHPKTDGLCAISIRVTYERKKKYYPTAFSCTPADFQKIIGERPRKEFKEAAQKLNALEHKASNIIAELPVFSWSAFEKRFSNNRGAKDELNTSFTDYIVKLKEEGRIGTSVSYECSKRSLNTFTPNAKFKEVTPEYLRKYEKWMLDAGKSITTVGIYLRQLRTIFNIAIDEGLISKEYYPFGSKKYEIPTGNNTKKALTIEQIASVYYYKAKKGTSNELAQNIWLFIYLCNGINVKDLCLLKYENIKGEFLEFNRSKTLRTKRKVEAIRVSLTDDAKLIIEKFGNKDKNKGNYIFPVLTSGLSAERERYLIQLFTRLINDQMLNIAKDLKIEGKLTTYVARHSFSTILQRSGASTEFISEALGHSNVKTTQNYLAGFEDESKKEKAKALTAFKTNN